MKRGSWDNEMHPARKFTLSLFLIVVFVIALSVLIFTKPQVTGGAVTSVSSCRALNQPNTEYRITGNINAGNLNPCFQITADNVTLNGMGYTLFYASESPNLNNFIGVTIELNVKNATVKNFVFRQLSSSQITSAVYLKGAQSSLIENNTIVTTGQAGYGIVLFPSVSQSGRFNSTDNTIRNNIINTTGLNAHGIYLSIGSTNNNILSNAILTQGAGAYVIFLESSNNNVVDGNTLASKPILGTANQAYGIYAVNSNANTLRSNRINTSADATEGIVLKGSSGNTLSSNIIGANGRFSSGVLLENSSNNFVMQNIIAKGFNERGSGIILQFFSNENTLSGNSIQSLGNFVYGVTLNTVSRNVLSSNNIMNSGAGSYAINAESSFGNTFSSNSLSTTGNGAYANYLYNSSSNVFDGNTISTSGSDGQGIVLVANSNSNTLRSNSVNASGASSTVINLDGSSQNIFEQIALQTSQDGSPAMRFFYSQGNTINSLTILTQGLFSSGIISTNSSVVATRGTIQTSRAENVYLSDSSSIILVNISYKGNQTESILDSPSLLTRKWYVEVYARDSAGNNIEDAEITISNATNATIFRGFTSRSGRIPLQELIEYTMNNSTRIYQQIYFISGNKSVYGNSSVVIDLSNYTDRAGNKRVVLNLSGGIIGPAIACYTDAECSDGNASTQDICNLRGTTESYCSHSAIIIRCIIDSDCNDFNSGTQDTCVNPGTSASSCSNIPISPGECSRNTDCDDGDENTIDTCINPGQASSACRNESSDEGARNIIWIIIGALWLLIFIVIIILIVRYSQIKKAEARTKQPVYIKPPQGHGASAPTRNRPYYR